ncbi:MAG: lamin tail domain-containing protein, partial [Planctomycetes bacterium]|nr:lamin tail domain-containing protein [Planctomycetota bacterium]
MKNIGLTTFALLALLATDSAAQQVGVRINEIQLHAASTSSVAQQIELKNHTNSAVDLTGYQLVTGGGQTALPGLLLSGGHTVVLHLGVSGTDTATDLFLPTAATLVPPDAISLFRSPAVTQPGELMDFVSFGGGHQGIAMAVTAGQWPSSQATVPLPPSGASLAHFDEVVYGSPDRPEAWFVDGTPTLGASNDGGGVFLA